MGSVFWAVVFLGCEALADESPESVKHVCGNGPHTVKVRVEDRKVCERPNPRLLPDDTYQQLDEICTMEPEYVDIEFSDWPECAGAEQTLDTLIFNTGTYILSN